MNRLAPISLAVCLCLASSAASSAELNIVVDSSPVLQIPDSPKAAVITDGLSSALPGLLQYLSELGIDRQVNSLVKEMTPRIAQELEFAGSGGILLIADLQVRPSEAGDYVRLVGDSLHYVGIGSTPVEAQLAELTRDSLRAAPDAGWKLDLDRSTALWIKRGQNGTIGVWQMTKRALVQGVLAKYSERKLAGFDWEAQRRDEIQRLISAGERRALDDNARRQISELGVARDNALKQRQVLDEELTRELRRASVAARNAMVVRGLAGLADFGLSAAKDGLNGSDKSKLEGATSNSGLLGALGAIENDARSRGSVIAEQIKVTTTRVNDLERQRIEIIRIRGVPTSNIPTGQAPQLSELP